MNIVQYSFTVPVKLLKTRYLYICYIYMKQIASYGELLPSFPYSSFILRMEAPGCADLYSNPRACGGKHTVTQNKTQGPTVTSGKNMSLK